MNETPAPTLSERMVEFMNRSTTTIAVETSILLLIGLTAIGGNLLVVISIYRIPSLRTITNYFVLSLAVSDILYAVLGLPLTIVWSIESRYILGQKSCVFQVIISFGLMHVSVSSIALMAINRFVCVCKSQKYKKVFNKKTCLVMIAAVWCMTFIWAALNIQGGYVIHPEFEPHKLWCGLSLTKKSTLLKIFMNVVLIVCLIFPLSIIVYCYFRVFKRIREHKRNIAPASNPNNLGTSVQEIKVTWTMFAVLLGFCATWIPVLVVVLVSNHYRVPREVHMIVTYAVASSTAINPFIYGVMNPAFRREYKKIIRCQPNGSEVIASTVE